MDRRTMPASSDSSSDATARLENGLQIVCEGGDARRGDPIEAYIGDDLVGAATLRPKRRGGALAAHIDFTDIADPTFPARLRVMNMRSGAEIGPGFLLADAQALTFAAGPPALTATFAGVHPQGVVFQVTVDRLARQPRRFVLHAGDAVPASAWSQPGAAGSPHRVVFPLAEPLRPGAPLRIVESAFGVVAACGPFDASHALSGAFAQLARLEGEVADLRAANDRLRRRLDTALDLGRERLLLDRLDLFYLLLCERIDRTGGAPPRDPVAPPHIRRFRPAEVDGIGIFDVETDGRNEWRWFGPEATIALRDIVGPVRRVVLYFHGFGSAAEPPPVRVSTGGPAQAITPRSLEGRYALDVPVLGATQPTLGMLIVHLSFDRHQTSEADPRLLSAVFSGAEVVSAAA